MKVARDWMHSSLDVDLHFLLVSELCAIPVQFAKEMGFWVESLSTNGSVQMWIDWRAKHCQPDYRKVQAHFIEQPNPL